MMTSSIVLDPFTSYARLQYGEEVRFLRRLLAEDTQ
jgi:hypothetical protein